MLIERIVGMVPHLTRAMQARMAAATGKKVTQHCLMNHPSLLGPDPPISPTVNDDNGGHRAANIFG